MVYMAGFYIFYITSLNGLYISMKMIGTFFSDPANVETYR